jgi:D-xylose transport system substrate-binding protein
MKNVASKLIIVLTVLIFTFCGCGRQAKIGLLMHSFEKERWRNDHKYFVESIEELGGDVVVAVAENDAKKQYKQAEELLNIGVDVLVIVPVDQFGAARIVELAHQRGVKVIAYDRLINNSRVDYYISADNVKIGEMQAKYLTKIKPSGNYALIGGSVNDNNSRMLFIGQMNVLQPFVERDEINIVYNEFTKYWSEDEGYRHALKCFEKTGDKLDAIIAGNDAIAYGALRAVKERGLEGKVSIAGQDADLRNLHEIIRGNQTVTIYKPIKTMASTAAELSIKLTENGEFINVYTTVSNGKRLVPSLLLESIAVNENNIQFTVVAEGYQAEQEVFK